MSRKQPVDIDVNEKIRVNPSNIFESEVVRSGNGAVIKAYKRFIGKRVIVIVDAKIKKPVESLDETAERYSTIGWKYVK